jgi:hypothetical protein
VLLGAETHLSGCHAHAAWVRALAAGWRGTFGPAAPSPRSERGTCAGTAVLIRSNVARAPLGEYDGPHATLGTSSSLVGAVVHTRRTEILVLAAYFSPGLGFTGANLDILQEVARLVGPDRRAFVLGADFNSAPAALEDTGWLRAVDACVWPCSTAYTCRQGQGTYIDFFVVSRSLAPFLSEARAILDVPWQPHVGLLLPVLSTPRSVILRTLVCPLPFEKVPARVAALGLSPACPDTAGTAWASATRWASSADPYGAYRHGLFDHPDLGAHPDALGTQATSLRLGLDLAAWSLAAEGQALALLGLPLGHPAARPFLGRALPPVFRATRLRRERPIPWDLRVAPGGADFLSSLWLSIASLLRHIGGDVAPPSAASARARALSLLRRIVGAPPRARLGRAFSSLDEAPRLALLGTLGRISLGSATSAEVDLGLATLLSLASEAAAAARARAKASWRAWVTGSLCGGASKAHRWANAPNSTPFLPTVVRLSDGTLSADPVEVVESFSDRWRLKWQCDDAPAAALALEAVRDLRRQCLRTREHLRSPAPDLSPSAIRRACSLFPSSTSIGADHWRFTELASLTDEALTGLAPCFAAMLTLLAAPSQTLVVVVCLIGKKSGDSRAIAVLASTYRLLLKLLQAQVKAWDLEVAGPWDHAIAGSSALRAGILRGLDLELAGYEHLLALEFLWDLDSFYDSVLVGPLLREARRLGYPPGLLVLGLQYHRAPRFLRVGRCYASRSSGFARSILAGCLQSNSWARGLLHRTMHRLSRLPSVVSGQYVDDVGQVVTHRSATGLREAAVQAAIIFAEGIRDNGLTLSVKSVLLPASSPHARRVARTLGQLGISVSLAPRAEDLGLGTTGGTQRSTCAAAKRLRKAAVRAARVRSLAQADPHARKLTRTGVLPQASYGTPALGAAPSHIQSLRRTAALATGLARKGGCTTALLHWEFGGSADPGLSTPLAQLGAWFDLWTSAAEPLRARLRRAWLRALPALRPARSRWARVRGPLGATVATLLDLGWRPIAADIWLTPAGDESCQLLGVPFARPHILQRIRETTLLRSWGAAATHHLGQGLEEGPPSLHVALREAQAARRRGDFLRSRAIDLVAIGATWTQERLIRGHSLPSLVRPPPLAGERGISPLCPRCGERSETSFHRYWACPANALIPDPAVSSSQHLSERAAVEWDKHACLWGRGLLPFTRWHSPSPDPTEEQAQPVIGPGFADLACETGIVYTDGAGGPDAFPEPLRRVACGAAAYSPATADTGRRLALLCAAVPGRQTVARAEVWGAVTALRALPLDAAVAVYSDASYVTNGVSRIGRLCTGPNGDVWTPLRDILVTRTGVTAFRKVKAHLAGRDVACGTLSQHALVGNALADAAAGHASALAQLHESIAEWYSHQIGLATLVIRRLAAIEAHIWTTSLAPEVPFIADPPPAPPTLRAAVSSHLEALAARGHSLRRDGDWLRCTTCLRRARPLNHSFWARTPCTSAPPLGVRRRGPPRHHAASSSAAPPPPPAGAPHGDPSPPSCAEASEPSATPALGAAPHPFDDSDDAFDDGEDAPPSPPSPPAAPSPDGPRPGSGDPPHTSHRLAVGARRSAVATARVLRSNAGAQARATLHRAWPLAIAAAPSSAAASAGAPGAPLPPHLWAGAHASHDLRATTDGTTLYCAHCGAYARLRLVSLRLPCPGQASGGSRSVLDRLSRGLSPKRPPRSRSPRRPSAASSVAPPRPLGLRALPASTPEGQPGPSSPRSPRRPGLARHARVAARSRSPPPRRAVLPPSAARPGAPAAYATPSLDRRALLRRPA